jgi:hypothetical protein
MVTELCVLWRVQIFSRNIQMTKQIRFILRQGIYTGLETFKIWTLVGKEVLTEVLVILHLHKYLDFLDRHQHLEYLFYPEIGKGTHRRHWREDTSLYNSESGPELSKIAMKYLLIIEKLC